MNHQGLTFSLEERADISIPFLSQELGLLRGNHHSHLLVVGVRYYLLVV